MCDGPRVEEGGVVTDDGHRKRGWDAVEVACLRENE